MYIHSNDDVNKDCGVFISTSYPQLFVNFFKAIHMLHFSN